MPANYLINGTPSEFDRNDLDLIRRAATSDEAREVTVGEIAAARLEGDHEFADGMQVLLDEADRIRKRERTATRPGDSAQRPAAVPMGR